MFLRFWALNKMNYHIELFANLPFHILLPCCHSQKVIGSARAFGNRYITQTLNGTGLPTKLNNQSQCVMYPPGFQNAHLAVVVRGGLNLGSCPM